jgi:hypothetical protein
MPHRRKSYGLESGKEGVHNPLLINLSQNALCEHCTEFKNHTNIAQMILKLYKISTPSVTTIFYFIISNVSGRIHILFHFNIVL